MISDNFKRVRYNDGQENFTVVIDIPTYNRIANSRNDGRKGFMILIEDVKCKTQRLILSDNIELGTPTKNK